MAQGVRGQNFSQQASDLKNKSMALQEEASVLLQELTEGKYDKSNCLMASYAVCMETFILSYQARSGQSYLVALTPNY